MTEPLAGRTIAFVATDGVEQVELKQPWEVLRQAGAEPRLVSIEPGEIRGYHHLEQGDPFAVDSSAGEVQASDFDAFVLPGGVANPDQLRMDDAVVALVRDAVTRGIPVGVICHGPWTLIEAGVVDGRRLTSYPSLATDLRNAGAEWVDEEVVICDHGLGPIVSSRRPDDLDAFCDALLQRFAPVPADVS